jgi:phytoene synthase
MAVVWTHPGSSSTAANAHRFASEPMTPLSPAALPSQEPAPTEAQDLAACRALLANGSRTFLAASMLLPRAVRDSACALYAFCRMADDEVDGQVAGEAVTPGPGAPPSSADEFGAVMRLRQRLRQLYLGQPGPLPADRALAVVVRRYAIPAALPMALLEGFEWDARGRRYDTLAELQDYAARVAGTVGAMMALLMDVRGARALARACDLGVAMQLSNIARDVGEDARMGRLYLPRDWMRQAGLDPDAWLADPRWSPALAGVIERLLREADRLYARAAAGVRELPLTCRPGINAARLLYAQIGLEVERRALNPIDSRAVVAPWRKIAGLLHGAALLWPSGAQAEAPPLPATLFLVEAVAGPLPAHARRQFHPPGWPGVISLFERLERQDRGWSVGDA